MAKNKPLRVDAQALAAWKRATGIDLDDLAAANSAVRVAADLPRREAEAVSRGMNWIVNWAERGLFDMQALRGGDVEIRVEGLEVHARIGDARFTILSNPTLAKHAVKVANEAAS